jgi:ParB/RepB/Spo0J family partition protein
MISTDIPIGLIDPNPWQPRQSEDPAHIKQLAESIQAHGLLQIPSARKTGDRYQLAFGHSRLAALRQIGADTMPLAIVELDDRGMAKAAAAENVARKDLSAIETARAIARYIQDFGATQTEAGAVYGYSNQASVSNLLRLLQLPAPVTQLVHTGQLAERHARQLLAVSRFDAQRCGEIARNLVAADPENGRDVGTGLSYRSPDDLVREQVGEFVEKRGKRLDDGSFDPDWPKKPIDVPAEIDIKGAPAQLPSCKGCEFRVKGRWSNEFCMRPPCFQAKLATHALAGVKKAAKDLGIPMLTPGEKGKLIYDGSGVDSDLRDHAERLMKAKHEWLRIGIITKNDYNSYTRKRVFGNEFAALYTVDESALKAVADKAPVKKAKPSSPRFDPVKRQTEDDRSHMVRRAGAKLLASVMPKDERLQRWLLKMPMVSDFWIEDDYANSPKSQTQAEFESATPATRKVMLAAALIDAVGDGWGSSKDLRDAINEAARDLGVSLPKGWADAAIDGPIPDDKPWRRKGDKK